MLKKDAIKHLGGNVQEMARRVGVTRGACQQWPDELPDRIADRVIAARLRGIESPRFMDLHEVWRAAKNG